MKVIILAGGLGTRLREETEYRPKPLVEIGGRPVLWHIMKSFAYYGIRDFVICLGYRGNMIKDYFINYEAMNNDFTIDLGRSSRITYHDAHGEQEFHITLAETGLETMTGGRVRRVQKYIDDDEFIVTYGDGLSNINIGSLLEFHQSHGCLATVTTVRPTSRFGVLDLDGDGRVASFKEKPQLDGWISAGYFVFNKEVMDFLTEDSCVLEREPLERLTAEGQLRAYRHHGFFHVMDTFREYKQLNDLWSSGNAPWRVWE